MQTIVADESARTDEELVSAAVRGDDDAFAALYGRYFGQANDLSIRVLRDEAAAADAVQVAFVRAWESLRKGRPPGHFRPWLLAIVHNATIDEFRRRKRFVTPSPDTEDAEETRTGEFTVLDTNRERIPEAFVQDQDLVRLVWTAAATMEPQQLALLDLHLRKGLTADELADHLRLSKGNVYTRLSRARDSLERAVAAELLFRRGRRDCPQLNALLTVSGEKTLTKSAERLISRHLRHCDVCEENRRRFTAPRKSSPDSLQ